MKKFLLILGILGSSTLAMAQRQAHGGAGGGGSNTVPETPCDFVKRQWANQGGSGNPKIVLRNKDSIQLLGDGGVNLTMHYKVMTDDTWELVPTSKTAAKISDDRKSYSDSNKSWVNSDSAEAQGPHFFSNKLRAMRTALKKITDEVGEDGGGDPLKKAAIRCLTEMADKVQTSEDTDPSRN